MIISSKKGIDRGNGKSLPHIAFLLLFPGFFFYQTLLGLGVIGAFLGGYFTVVALFLTGPLIYACYIESKKSKRFFSTYDLLCLVYIIYFLMVIGINYVSGTNNIIAQRYIQSVIFCVETYIIFRLTDLSNRKFIFVIGLSLLLMSITTIYLSIDGFFYLQALGQAKDPDNLATYQGFARSYIYTFLIVTALVKTTSSRMVIYSVAIATLYLNGARSEFSAVLFSVPLIEIYYTKHKLAWVFALSGLLTAFLTTSESIATMLPENRTLQLLDLSHSSSAVARQHLSSDAWRTITENPILGSFASYSDGHYAHNILCAWVDFGLFGFVFFSLLLLFPAYQLVSRGLFDSFKSVNYVLALSLVCITILWAVSAKNVPDMSVGAALGAFAKYRYQDPKYFT
jgi:hypothetical protein